MCVEWLDEGQPNCASVSFCECLNVARVVSNIRNNFWRSRVRKHISLVFKIIVMCNVTDSYLDLWLYKQCWYLTIFCRTNRFWLKLIIFNLLSSCALLFSCLLTLRFILGSLFHCLTLRRQRTVEQISLNTN